ncbi:glucose 1-dehydrogenase [Flavobacterium sp. ANB]|jgi:NAD(P)-dependent dehydrogenase (short-subunit alcohol dehydrogenase family)|uniref:SDR family NAD(P)-dependent oxidoreductase n=1 Tax=unclassified Flavobacterium TaxID=196869 RepID=UPI0012B8F1F3|nr:MULTISPECIES: glucose 1-dehydrogenase [unclassified Flavobacterium]MBF4517469.1 glucose 1-dehydrogenase [Flavobacterium sp. ANB]MTD72099.1 glucose 1-dehydrogenase [Flavobacterium sp. LC2016-13]
MNKLKNKVVVITGGNSGIGFGIAEAFKNEGAAGVIVGRNQKTLDSSVAQLGDDFIAINADVTNVADLEKIFAVTSEKFGKIDVIVANAGGGIVGTVENIGETDYDKTMDLNLKSVYFTVHKALPYMNDGGSIILIGSNAAHRAYPSFTLYGAAKAAVIYLAKGFSSDLLGRRIRANVITPGTTDTPAFEKFVPAEQIEGLKTHFAGEMPIGRIGQPSDIGKTAVFLASDDSSFMLGAELLVDGGMTYLAK